jgi:hypothetical protein
MSNRHVTELHGSSPYALILMATFRVHPKTKTSTVTDTILHHQHLLIQNRPLGVIN